MLSADPSIIFACPPKTPLCRAQQVQTEKAEQACHLGWCTRAEMVHRIHILYMYIYIYIYAYLRVGSSLVWVLELYNGSGRVGLSSMIARVWSGLEVYAGKLGRVTGNPHF